MRNYPKETEFSVKTFQPRNMPFKHFFVNAFLCWRRSIVWKGKRCACLKPNNVNAVIWVKRINNTLPIYGRLSGCFNLNCYEIIHYFGFCLHLQSLIRSVEIIAQSASCNVTAWRINSLFLSLRLTYWAMRTNDDAPLIGEVIDAVTIQPPASLVSLK